MVQEAQQQQTATFVVEATTAAKKNLSLCPIYVHRRARIDYCHPKNQQDANNNVDIIDELLVEASSPLSLPTTPERPTNTSSLYQPSSSRTKTFKSKIKTLLYSNQRFIQRCASSEMQSPGSSRAASTSTKPPAKKQKTSSSYDSNTLIVWINNLENKICQSYYNLFLSWLYTYYHLSHCIIDICREEDNKEGI